MNKKKIIIITLIIIIALIVSLCFYLFIIKNSVIENQTSKVEDEIKHSEDITIVPTMLDEITTNSSWCGTFQLVWNDMKNQLVKGNVLITPSIKIVENLNKEDFNEEMLSDEYYYKTWGIQNLELKSEIEKDIKEKFDQKSDILEQIDWENGKGTSYLFYTMLYRKFEFLQSFDVLVNSNFSQYENIEYFGISKTSNNSLGNQIDVLHYESINDFAILINTKNDDEVIFCKNPEGKTFKEIYENMSKKAEKYDGNKKFNDGDEFKAPKLQFDEIKQYEELIGKQFTIENGESVEISEALQTIKFSLDEKGGKIKSEAAISVAKGIEIKEEEKSRLFYVDDTFVIFLREKGKKMPYFAGRVEDITKFQ